MATDERFGKSMIGLMEVVTMVMYLITLGLSAWSLNKFINGEQNHPHLGGNSATSFLVVFSLLAAVMGTSSTAGSIMHRRCRAGRSDQSLDYANSAVGFVSWAVTAIAFGLVCKQIQLGGHRGKRLQSLEVFVGVSLLNHFIYLVLHRPY